MLNRIYARVILLSAIFIHGCGSGSSPPIVPPISSNYTLSAEFSRIEQAGLDPFIVSVNIMDNNMPVTGAADRLNITLSRGSHSAVSESNMGVYQFTVSPQQSGEHKVDIAYEGVSFSRTALVVEKVHPDWGQPMSVPGLVNTAGYEDGVTVTPDGEYLFIQYGPFYFSAITLFQIPRAQNGCGGQRLIPTRCTHPWIDDVIGPTTAPERPGFFTGRIMDGMFLHNANSWGVGPESAPIFAVTTLFYGFKRQADGSFAEPFFVAFEDENDGIANPAGLSFLMNGDGTAEILFFHNDSDLDGTVDEDNSPGTAAIDSGFDIYTSTITFGQDNVLGTYVYSGTPGTPPLRSGSFGSELVNFGKTGIKGIAGTQGNPHFQNIGSNVQAIWTDDEFDEVNDLDSDYGDLSLFIHDSGTLTGGNWTKVTLPEPVNLSTANSKEIQPFFTGDELYFTRSDDSVFPQIHVSAYSGDHLSADYANSTSWANPELVLGIGNVTTIGQVTAIGEPTIAKFDGEEYLYFVYGVIRDNTDPSGIPDINMQAGFVKKN